MSDAANLNPWGGSPCERLSEERSGSTAHSRACPVRSSRSHGDDGMGSVDQTESCAATRHFNVDFRRLTRDVHFLINVLALYAPVITLSIEYR